MTTKTKHIETSRSPRIQFVGFCLTVAFALVFLTACESSNRVKKQGNLRIGETQSLEEQVDALQEKLAQREGELQPIREALGDPLLPIDRAEPSRLAGIVLGVYSGPVDLDGDTAYDAMRVYVHPIDQHSRPIAAKGTARFRLIATDTGGDMAAVLDQTYDADAFAATRHASIIGTQYIFKADLPANRPATATIQITLTDAATGKAFKAEKEVSLVRPATP